MAFTKLIYYQYERIRESLDKGEFACGVFVDLQKAFDIVDHGILLTKLDILVSKNFANKISLNASKSESAIFHSPWKPLDCIPHLKLSGKILTASKSVKYLGVHLDEHLSWRTHIASIATKLRRANGALSKLRHYVPTQILLKCLPCNLCLPYPLY